MHDQSSASMKPRTAEEQKAYEESQAAIGVLYSHQLRCRKEHAPATASLLEENAQLLSLVPEAYSMYNYRREMLQALWADSARDSSPAGEAAPPPRNVLADLTAELRLNSRILEKDFKVYAAFVHRHWIYEELGRRAAAEAVAEEASHQRCVVAAATSRKGDDVPGGDGGGGAEDPSPAAGDGTPIPPILGCLLHALGKEAAQCSALLARDERNFHAWNHRRWALAQLHAAQELQSRHRLPHPTPAATAATVGAGGPARASAVYDLLFSARDASDLAYVTEKIQRNFSNYSAWHQRALVMTRALLQRHKDAAVTVDPSYFALQPPHDDARRGEALRALLSEDLQFLTQAVFCDPNDQAAWFYAPFMIGLFEAACRAFPATFAPRVPESAGPSPYDERADGPAATTAATAAAAVGQESSDSEDEQEKIAMSARGGGENARANFLHAVCRLIRLCNRLGDADCYMPHAFLLMYFHRLCQAAQRDACAASLAQHELAELASRPSRRSGRHSLLDSLRSPSSAVAAAGVVDATHPSQGVAGARAWQRQTLRELSLALHAHLVRVDKQRSGLYDDMLEDIRVFLHD